MQEKYKYLLGLVVVILVPGSLQSNQKAVASKQEKLAPKIVNSKSEMKAETATEEIVRLTEVETMAEIIEETSEVEEITEVIGIDGEEVTEESAYEIQDFPIIYQNPELPTGCEITALTMLLNFYKVAAEKQDMAQNYLPKAKKGNYYGSDGRLYGNDINSFFIGNPFSEGGVTCGIKALVTAADAYAKDYQKNLVAEDITGKEAEELYNLIDENIPVLVLVTISMDDRWHTEGWYNEKGEYVDWSKNDHGAVLIGYTKDTVIIADPISGHVEYSKKQFEKVYESRGRKSLILK